MLVNFTKRVEEREEVLHIFWKTLSSLSIEQYFIEVKTMRGVTSLNDEADFFF